MLNTCTIIELEHYDNNIIEKNRYMESMQKAVYQIIEFFFMKFKYSAEEKFQIVMESFSENVTQAEICRRHDIYPVQLSKWKEQFILGGKSALSQRNTERYQIKETSFICMVWIGSGKNNVTYI